MREFTVTDIREAKSPQEAMGFPPVGSTLFVKRMEATPDEETFHDWLFRSPKRWVVDVTYEVVTSTPQEQPKPTEPPAVVTRSLREFAVKKGVRILFGPDPFDPYVFVRYEEKGGDDEYCIAMPISDHGKGLEAAVAEGLLILKRDSDRRDAEADKSAAKSLPFSKRVKASDLVEEWYSQNPDYSRCTANTLSALQSLGYKITEPE